ncbi:MAG: DNA polymerase Y family protein [Actinobacteria bacterium]|nr:DNA polymerase Y family protein [Actinomycetota bacterium]MBV9933036.1 DNA polymerase Y family protein [Actinomycetota bacterium]
MTATRTLVVWCPDWPVTAAGIDAETPAAVVFANRVVACSAGARGEGVKRGLRRREAQGRCPELVIIEHDPGRDARAFEPVVAAVESLTPRVEIVRPGLCALATRGPSRYFGGDHALARLMADTVTMTSPAVLAPRSVPDAPDRGARTEEGRGFPSQVGIADGLFAAELAARQSLVVPAGESPQFLAPFPIDALDRPELADLLQRLGIRTLGAFAALPATDVLARFGPEGAVAHRLARGRDERMVAGRQPPPDLSVSLELDPPAERVDTAAFAAKQLAHELHEQLADRGLACTRVAIEADTEHGEHLVRLWRHDGALTPAAMAERVRWQLDGWLTASGGLSGGLTLIRLTPDEVKPASGRQLGFWGGAAEADERAGRGLARVQGILGIDAVVTAVLTGGRSPAEQVRLVPWGDARQAEPVTEPWPGRVPAPAPSTVHVPPMPTDVVDANGAPVAVTGRGLLAAEPARLAGEAVTAWAGPWLADERWWDPPAHRRRARFQMVTADGVARLVALENGRWWVEATYD